MFYLTVYCCFSPVYSSEEYRLSRPSADKQQAFDPNAIGFSPENNWFFGRKHHGSQSKGANNAVINTLLLDHKRLTMPIHTPRKRGNRLFLSPFPLYFRISEKEGC